MLSEDILYILPYLGLCFETPFFEQVCFGRFGVEGSPELGIKINNEEFISIISITIILCNYIFLHYYILYWRGRLQLNWVINNEEFVGR